MPIIKPGPLPQPLPVIQALIDNKTAVSLQKEQPIPNVAYVPMVMFQTGINAGVVTTSCQITYAAALYESGEEYPWTLTGQVQTTYIPDVANLEPELADLGTQLADAYATLVDVVNQINAIKQVM